MVGSLGATMLVMSRQAMWLEAIERRIAATTSMLSAMKGVKMCGLTEVLSKTLQDLRVDELRISKKFRKLLIWNMAFSKLPYHSVCRTSAYQFAVAYITPVAAPIVTFAVFSVIARNSNNGVTLDTARVFTSLSLFTLLSDPLQSLIMTLVTFMGAVGSFHRIQEFLCTEARLDSRKGPCDMELLFNIHGGFVKKKVSASTETADSEGERSLVATPHEDYRPLSEYDAVIVIDGVFGWDSTKEPLLKDINMAVPREKFTIVVGPVGCGKSTLLKALLGEVPLLGGSIHVSSLEVAFCDQTPWHMNGTIQESIIGVGKLEDTWYSTVLHACALIEDLRQLSRGDQTTIGSKGISLSGGQSQRIVSFLSPSSSRRIPC
jgi:ATP-binding cassette subfamily C (CFTR/MRP) protein 1